MSPPTPPSPRALILDWDNTLVDSWAIIHDALNHTFDAFGKERWSMDDVRRRVRKSMRESFPPLFGDAWEEAGDVFYARFEAIHTERLAPLPGAGELIDTLHARGIYLGIVSNKKGTLLRAEADQLGWSARIGQVIGAADAARDKPAVDPVRMALSGSGIAPGPDVWFAGDADVDMECAHNAGCTAVLVRAEAPGADEFSHFPPDLYAPDCEALSKLALTM